VSYYVVRRSDVTTAVSRVRDQRNMLALMRLCDWYSDEADFVRALYRGNRAVLATAHGGAVEADLEVPGDGRSRVTLKQMFYGEGESNGGGSDDGSDKGWSSSGHSSSVAGVLHTTPALTKEQTELLDHTDPCCGDVLPSCTGGPASDSMDEEASVASLARQPATVQPLGQAVAVPPTPVDLQRPAKPLPPKKAYLRRPAKPLPPKKTAATSSSITFRLSVCNEPVCVECIEVEYSQVNPRGAPRRQQYSYIPHRRTLAFRVDSLQGRRQRWVCWFRACGRASATQSVCACATPTAGRVSRMSFAATPPGLKSHSKPLLRCPYCAAEVRGLTAVGRRL
jgi:hypothetical protein